MMSKRVSPYQCMHVWDEAGDAQKVGEITFNAADMNQIDLGYIVENIVIQSSLYEVLQQRQNIEWYLNETIGTVVTHNDHVEVRLDDDQIIITKLLVGADGHRSMVRSFAEISYTEKSYKQLGLVARIKTEFSHENTAWQRFLSTGPLALLPLNNGQEKSNIYVQLCGQ